MSDLEKRIDALERGAGLQQERKLVVISKSGETKDEAIARTEAEQGVRIEDFDGVILVCFVGARLGRQCDLSVVR